MYYIDPLSVEKLTALYVDEARGQGEACNLLHQGAMGEQKGLSQRGRWVLSHMGHQLVVLGEWLEQYSSPQHSY